MVCKTVFVCGVPGVGKSTLARKLNKEKPRIRLWEASQVNTYLERAKLTFSEAQLRLSEEIQKRIIAVNSEWNLLVGHAILSGKPVPLEAFQTLNLISIIMVQDAPIKIYLNRINDKLRIRRLDDEEQIAKDQTREAKLVEQYARALGISFHIVNSSEFQEFKSAINKELT